MAETTHANPTKTPAQDQAVTWIDEHMATLLKWHTHVWNLAEPAWREYRSADWYMKTLREHGFTVEAGSGGMPTAFCAEWSNGPGPTLLSYAEYDAVPGNCQAAVPREEPRSGLSRFAPGHTDPHSALGISTLAGLLATKHAMETSGITGTLRYTGEPAEKMQGSKVVHGLRGYYDGVDAVISFHPFYMLPLCNTARWDTHCGAYFSKVYTFTCDDPQDWQQTDPSSPIPASHSAARAPGANIALMNMHLNAKAQADSMLPANGGWSLSDAIISFGQATADNLPARRAQIQYSWRCPTVEMAEHIERVLDRNASAAAELGFCTVESQWVSRTRPGLANHALAEALYHELTEVGAPEYSAQAVEFAQAIQTELGQTPSSQPFLTQTQELITPQDAEAKLREFMPGWQKNWTSDDYVEMTHYAPTVRFYISRPTLAPAAEAKAYPAWVMNALGGDEACIAPTIDVAGKTIARTNLRLLTDPELLSSAQNEFQQRSTAAQQPPLLPADFAAPIDLPWPEYYYSTQTSADGKPIWPVN